MSNIPHNPHLGDIDQFVRDNGRLVHFVCNRVVRFTEATNKVVCDYDDIYSTGMIGLIKGYKKFDPKFGVKFSTYGVPMIYGEIQRSLRDHNIGLTFSRSYKEAYYKMKKADMIGIGLDPNVIADKLDMDIKAVNRGLEYAAYRHCMNMDEVSFENDGESVTLGEQVGYKVDYDANLIIKEFLSTLVPKERSAFELHAQGYTQSEIGKVLGVTQVQISRLLTKVDSKALEYRKDFSTNAV